ncbi:MAG: DUF3500 domain-containing protein [Dehalococcoidia bacterium]
MTTTAASSETRIVVERMAEAASALLATLAADQRRKATFGFPAEEERRKWYYTPTDHGGLPLGEMTPTQQQATYRLVSTGVSAPGFNTISTIIGIENVLDLQEGWRVNFRRERGRDPLLYYISIFGEPGGTAPWSWRFGGHHVSLHNTIVDGRIVSPTPTFFGSNPAETKLSGTTSLRPLAGEEDLGRELLHLLDGAQRAIAVVSPSAPWDMVTGNRPTVNDGVDPPLGWEIFREPFEGSGLEQRHAAHERTLQKLGITPQHIEAFRHTTAPKGLPGARMTAGQRDLLGALIGQYISRMPEEVAAPELTRLSGAALNEVHFAWAGGDQRRQPHYYRLQGPRFLVEYDNVQDDANHIHSVWRDPQSDFGAELLAQHYAQAH